MHNEFKEIWEENKDKLLVKKLQYVGFRELEIVAILGILYDTCKHCWDGEDSCQCWNDE